MLAALLGAQERRVSGPPVARAAQTRAPGPAPVTTIQPGYPYCLATLGLGLSSPAGVGRCPNLRSLLVFTQKGASRRASPRSVLPAVCIEIRSGYRLA